MKNEKHVALATKILSPWFSAVDLIFGWEDKESLVERVAWCIAQVEAEALASKVVFTEDDFFDFKMHKEFKERTKGDDWDKHVAALDHNPLAKWQRAYAAQRANEKLRSQITLAPKEPEDMSKKCEKCDISKEHVEGNDISRYEPDIKAQVVNEVVNKNEGCKSVVKEQVRLPEMYTSQMLISGGYEHGYNAAIDDMRKLNGLENV